MLRVLPVVALLACGSAARSQVKPIDIKPVPVAPVKACIRQPDEAAPVTHARTDGSIVSYCIGSAVDQCFALDVEAGTLKRIDQPPEAQDRSLTPVGHVEATNPDLKICNTAGCKTLTPQIWPGTAPLRAATNGTIAAVMLGDADKGKGYVDVFDVTKSKKLASFKYARGDFKCGDVAILGETIYVTTNMCANPSGRGALYSTTGRKIANVGGKGTFGTYGGAFTQLEGSLWAFLEENGNLIVVQDVVKGKVTKTIDVTTLFDPVKMANPGESVIVRFGTGQLAVIGGSPANGSVAIVTIASGDVKVVHAPLCSAAG